MRTTDIDIYRLIDAISDENDNLTITGNNFFDLCCELENKGVVYELSEYHLLRFESQFRSNVELCSQELKVYFSDDFRRTIKLLNQHNNYKVSESEIKEIWEKISK